MDFALPESHALWRDAVRAFAERALRPSAATLDTERRFPVEHLPLLAHEGLLSVHWPKEHGGAGRDTLAYVLALEELARVSPAHARERLRRRLHIESPPSTSIVRALK